MDTDRSISFMWFLLCFIYWPDTEPPSCSFCPADIVQEATTLTVRIYWKRPICSDNSGTAPNIQSNRQIGDLFSVPSTTIVQYTVSDGLNINNNCSFTVKLTGNLRESYNFLPARTTEVRFPNIWYAGLSQMERSEFELWPGLLSLALGHDARAIDE